jgi:hypothetical protein
MKWEKSVKLTMQKLLSDVYFTNFFQFSILNLAIDDEQLVRDIEQQLPSLPIAYWTKHKAIQAQANSKNAKQCAK